MTIVSSHHPMLAALDIDGLCCGSDTQRRRRKALMPCPQIFGPHSCRSSPWMLLTLVLAPLLFAARLDACSVPVYYYGLMRWMPSEHRIIAPDGAQLPENSN